MELVKFKSKGGVVTIEVVIEGLITWRYGYACDNGLFKKNRLNPGPYVHTLGLPHELSNDTDSWDIDLANISNSKQTYQTKIRWIQDGDILHEWIKKNDLEKDNCFTESGNAWLIGI